MSAVIIIFNRAFLSRFGAPLKYKYDYLDLFKKRKESVEKAFKENFLSRVCSFIIILYYIRMFFSIMLKYCLISLKNKES